MKVKAVVYVRVSSKEQEREGFSIPAQKKFLNAYAIDNGFTVVKTFEESESAKTAGRTQFKAMLLFLKAHPEIKIVLVEKTDRLYRNMKDYNALNFEELNLQIHLAKEGEILSKESRSHQKFIHGIKVLMAKNYSDNLSEEVIKGMSQKATQGLWPSVAPMGYLNNKLDHTIEPDPVRGPFIAKGFELAATGQYSLARLKRLLWEMGLRSTRSKAELSKSRTQGLLTNPIYYGDFVWKGQLFKGNHKPLISKHVFDQVQVQMGFVKRAKVSKNNFAFMGLMTCGHCGCSITAHEKTKKSGLKYIYYHCTSGKGKCEGRTYLREEIIENAFAEALAGLKIPDDVVEWTKNALIESHTAEKEFHSTQVANLEKQYRTLQTKIEKSYDDKLAGSIDQDFWIEMNSRFRSEQSKIEEQLSGLREANTAYIDQGIHLMNLASRAADLFKNMNSDEKRELMNLVLSNPRILNGSIEYDLKKPFSMFTNVTNLEDWRGGRDLNPRPSA